MPQLIIPLLIVGGWATLITCMSHFYHDRTFSRWERPLTHSSTNKVELSLSDSRNQQYLTYRTRIPGWPVVVIPWLNRL
jgi:hypothetical protein